MLKHIALAAFLFSSGVAMAAPAPITPVNIKNLPPVMKNLQSGAGMTVYKEFKAAGGLTGWVVKDVSGNSDYTIVFSTPDGETLVAGMLLTKDGTNLTAAYAAEHLPKPDHTPAYKAFAPGGEATSVVFGSAKAKAEIIVLFDANCGFCKIMHRMINPAVEAGELRVRYVPVGILGGDSPQKGAALLAAKDVKALADAYVNGGPAETSNDKALLAKVSANQALMTKFGYNGTPTVLYKVKNGNDETVVVSTGLPDMSTMFSTLKINGHLDKLKADPQLAKYLR